MDNQKNCIRCGAPIPVTTKFCPFCGTSQAVIPQGGAMQNMPQGVPVWEPAAKTTVPKKSVGVGYVVVLAVAILLVAGGAMLMFFSSIGGGLGFLGAMVLLLFGAIMFIVASLLSKSKKERQLQGPQGERVL